MDEKQRLYPVLEPTAPQDVRLQRISEIEQFLKTEVNTREGLYKKYKKCLNVLQGADTVFLGLGMSSTAASLALLATGVGAPIALGVQGVGIATGVVGVIGKVAERKVRAKSEKHDEIRVLAQAKLNTIAVKVARAFEDGCITDEEFRSITNEQKQYIDMKKDIQTKKALQTKLTEAEKKAIVQEALQDMLKNGKSQ